MLEQAKAAAAGGGAAASWLMNRIPPFAAAVVAFFALYAAVAVPYVLLDQGTWAQATVLLALVLIFLSAWDVTTFRLPDALTIPLIALGVALAPVDLMPWRLLSALAGGGALLAIALLYQRVRHREGMGLGDIKLFAAAGAWVGLESLSSVMLIACAAAAASILALRLIRISLAATDRIAFGPFLAFGLWIVWLYGAIDPSALWRLFQSTGS